MLSISALTCIFELIWIKTVYLKFPELAAYELKCAKERREQSRAAAMLQAQESYPPSWGCCRGKGVKGASKQAVGLTHEWAKGQPLDWWEFARMPIFISECRARRESTSPQSPTSHLCYAGYVPISLLMSALSFGPAFPAYLQSESSYSDPFIAAM